jgi:hypothetical protein
MELMIETKTCKKESVLTSLIKNKFRSKLEFTLYFPKVLTLSKSSLAVNLGVIFLFLSSNHFNDFYLITKHYCSILTLCLYPPEKLTS